MFSKEIVAGVIYCLIPFQIISALASERPIIRAAVAAEFKNGLHTRYLQYIADQLGMDISIITVPFARRMLEVTKGNLDIIVGLHYSDERANKLIYIYPAYEKLSFRFFSLNDNANKIKNYDDLTGKVIGVIRGAKYYSPFEQDSSLNKYPLQNIHAAIQMLLHNRIDLFIHYEESTVALLKSFRLKNKITKTNYQPIHNINHYIAISSKSPLVAKKQQLQAIIEKAVEQQDFLNIRVNYQKEKAEEF